MRISSFEGVGAPVAQRGRTRGSRSSAGKSRLGTSQSRGSRPSSAQVLVLAPGDDDGVGSGAIAAIAEPLVDALGPDEFALRQARADAEDRSAKHERAREERHTAPVETVALHAASICPRSPVCTGEGACPDRGANQNSAGDEARRATLRTMKLRLASACFLVVVLSLVSASARARRAARAAPRLRALAERAAARAPRSRCASTRHLQVRPSFSDRLRRQSRSTPTRPSVWLRKRT